MNTTKLHETLANCHPSLARGQVWCRTCGRTQKVKDGLVNGWPKCCGSTMTIDSPEEQKSLAAPSGSMFKVGQDVRHKKSGSVYRIVFSPTSNLRIESTTELAYAYTNPSSPSGPIWIRPQAEMEDGRFEVAPHNAKAEPSR